DQVKLAEKAGATIFGPVCNTNTNKTAPWNLSRAITFMKACGEVANIPIHVNMGMGVGAVTVHDNPPIDIVSRASKGMVCRWAWAIRWVWRSPMRLLREWAE
ncbi:MAG: hypothetical protein JRE58_15145, partial [Deltaproteobacteria bacterium]|nr:hypothetical protein [Deltaproteobacteria bacterium]